MSIVFSKLPNSDRLYVPDNSQQMKSTNDFLERMGLVYQVSSGFNMLSPIVQEIQNKLEAIAYEESLRRGFNPLSLPFLVSPEALIKSGKRAEYGNEFYSAKMDGREYLFSPTTEEAVISYLKEGGLKSYKQMSMRFYHPHHVFRHIKRPEGIFKSRDFRAILLSSFDANPEGFKESISDFSDICRDFFNRVGIDTYGLESEDGKIIEHLFACDIGDRPIEKGVIANRSQDAQGVSAIPEGAKLGNVAMGYEFDRVSRLGLKFVDRDSGLKPPIMGTFGIGIQRSVYALFQQSRAGVLDAFNAAVRPFDIILMSLGTLSDELNNKIYEIAAKLEVQGYKVAIDDRSSTLSKKMAVADMFSTPVRIPVSQKDIDNDSFQIRRMGGFPLSEARIDGMCNQIDNILK